MADLSSILADPNYVNANAATKQAIFDKFSANDTNFTGANPATQDAIRVKFGLTSNPNANLAQSGGGIPGQRMTAPAATTPPAKEAPSILGTLLTRPLDVLEVPYAMGRQLIAAPFAAAAEVYGAATSGKYGTPEGVRAGEQTAQRVQQEMGYQPRSEFAQYYLPEIGRAAEATGLQGVPIPLLDAATRTAGPALRTMRQNVQNVIKAPLPLGETVELQAARLAEQRNKESWQQAPKIDATRLAQKHSIALNPAESNPTAANRLKSTLAYSSGLDARLAANNEPQWNNAVRKDLGLPDTGPMSVLGEPVFEKLKTAKDVTQPYEAIRAIPEMRATPQIVNSLDKLQAKTLVGDTTGIAIKSNEQLATIKDQIRAGMTGDVLMDSIQQLRQEASSIYGAQKAGNPITPEQRQIAVRNMGVANALEDMIEANLTAQALKDFKNARVKIAKINDHELATNPLTGQVDPRVYADLLKEGKPLSGVAKELGIIAENSPSVSRINATGTAPVVPWTRSNLAGTAGAAAAAVTGTSPIFGGLIGSTIGRLASGVGTKTMVTPEYQAAHAMPRDYRVYPTTPAEVRYGPNQLAPYQPEVVGPSADGPANKLRIIGYDQEGRPIYKAEESRPGFTTPQQAPPFGPTVFESQRGLPNEVPKQIYQAQKNAELAQEFKAAAERKPARGGENLVFDAAGNLVPETPAGQANIIGAPTSLESAVQKLSGQVIEQPSTAYKTMTVSPKTGAQPYTRIIKKEGETTFERGVPRAFDLTATEKIAWDKARVDLAEVAPGFKSLTDKAIAQKMMDRKWIEETVAKAREKAAMFDDISKRVAGDQAKRDAAIKRDQMLDVLATLEERLRGARPDVSGKQQGPKTRAAKRNALAPESESQNNLVPPYIEIRGVGSTGK